MRGPAGFQVQERDDVLFPPGRAGAAETGSRGEGVLVCMGRDAMTCGGCLVSAAGAAGAVFTWGSSSRTQRHLGNGFENEGMDLGAVLTELPLVFLAGAVLPALVWGLGAWVLLRLRRESEFHV